MNLKQEMITMKKLSVVIFIILCLCLSAAAPALGDAGQPVRVMVLNGSTGFGMAKLMSDAAAGTSEI